MPTKRETFDNCDDFLAIHRGVIQRALLAAVDDLIDLKDHEDHRKPPFVLKIADELAHISQLADSWRHFAKICVDRDYERNNPLTVVERGSGSLGPPLSVLEMPETKTELVYKDGARYLKIDYPDSDSPYYVRCPEPPPEDGFLPIDIRNFKSPDDGIVKATVKKALSDKARQELKEYFSAQVFKHTDFGTFRADTDTGYKDLSLYRFGRLFAAKMIEAASNALIAANGDAVKYLEALQQIKLSGASFHLNESPGGMKYGPEETSQLFSRWFFAIFKEDQKVKEFLSKIHPDEK